MAALSTSNLVNSTITTAEVFYDPYRDRYMKQEMSRKMKEYLDQAGMKEEQIKRMTGIPVVMKEQPKKNLILLLEDV